MLCRKKTILLKPRYAVHFWNWNIPDKWHSVLVFIFINMITHIDDLTEDRIWPSSLISCTYCERCLDHSAYASSPIMLCYHVINMWLMITKHHLMKGFLAFSILYYCIEVEPWIIKCHVKYFNTSDPGSIFLNTWQPCNCLSLTSMP